MVPDAQSPPHECCIAYALDRSILPDAVSIATATHPIAETSVAARAVTVSGIAAWDGIRVERVTGCAGHDRREGGALRLVAVEKRAQALEVGRDAPGYGPAQHRARGLQRVRGVDGHLDARPEQRSRLRACGGRESDAEGTRARAAVFGALGGQRPRERQPVAGHHVHHRRA